MADGHERISPTAHVTAYTWHRIGMPHARHFVTRRGWLGFWSWRVLVEWWARLLTGTPTLQQILEYRHRIIEGAALAHAPDVLVEIAGGLSRRGVTFAVDHAIRTVEIDLPHVVSLKQGVLEASELSAKLGKHSLVARDVLSDRFGEELELLLGDAQRPVIVMEGLLSYFTLDQRNTLLASVGRALKGREGIVLCDAYTRVTRGSSLGSNALKAAIKMITRGNGPTDSWANQEELEASFTSGGLGQVGVALASELPAADRPVIGDEGIPAQVVRASPS
ncbi:MAG: class I SAM-dependent methyltransferase [Deltaproteobacteria bacterium]|nr:class I SAM-dependent methyltransferase [Deltaproteobacteria bacterium]